MGGRREMSRPPWTMVPASCISRPAMMRSKVVLPQPEGPRKVTSSPRSTASPMVSRAVKRPKVLRMPSSLKNGSRMGAAIETGDIALLIGSFRLECRPKKTRPGRGARSSAGLFRLRLAVVTLGPLGENLVPILGRPCEIIFHQPLFIIGGNVIQRFGDAGYREHGEILGEQFHRRRSRQPIHQLARGFDFLGRLQDSGRFEIPAQAFRRKDDVDRRTRFFGGD